MRKRQATSAVLVIGALGVVFGDIGTSPLYTLQAIASLGRITLSAENVYGAVSMIVWAVAIVVALKYVTVIMRADNDGEGGILALLGLLRAKLSHRRVFHLWLLLSFGGLALFYGDSVITPAISVLSAVEGVHVALPNLASFVVPITVAILALLFSMQSRGTGVIGSLFGPVMIVWFVASGVVGLVHVIAAPGVLVTLLPTTALAFFIHHAGLAFLLLGAVVLAVTGAEALYADMGHFGRSAVRRAWFWLVFPALLLNYMGQGALVAHDPSTISSAYFLLYPEALRIPALLLATCATLIASQAVIAGAFSLTRQAVRFGYLPPILIKHTSKEEIGQVYIGAINWLIFMVVILLVIVFGSSTKLAAAFGMAVSGTLLIDSLLFFAVMRYVKGWSLIKVILVAIGFLIIDSLFLASSLSKIAHGGWVPLLIATLAFTILTTWTRGHEIIGRERQRIEGKLQSFVSTLHAANPPIPRIEGSAVYLSHHAGFTPLALHATIKQLHELSSKVIVVSVETLEIPHVPLHARAKVDELGFDDDGISLVRLRFGFNDVPNVPLALEHIRGQSTELQFDPYTSAYFVSDSDLEIVKNHRMSRPRKLLFTLLQRNAASSIKYFHLPTERTVNMATYIEL